MHYNTFILSNGLRIIHSETNSPVSYCGFAINAGTRDEQSHEEGLAHFVEHMLFKGTSKRKSWHIINRMERVGGEINAYTTKEETFLYSIQLSEDLERAMELLGDLLFHSQYPTSEIEKEKEVVIDEINSYLDSPGELIYDDFENFIFEGSNLGHAILGNKESLNSFSSDSCRNFVDKHYVLDNICFFSTGKIAFKKIIKLAEKFFGKEILKNKSSHRKGIDKNHYPKDHNKLLNKELHQAHVMIGARAYSLYDDNRLALYLLNNILGGPGMNSRLNLSLREKNGLVYNVESSLTSYSDTGVLNIYFGCDHDSMNKCIHLAHKELNRLCKEKLSTSQFSTAIKQLKGQLGIGYENGENKALSLGKSYLRYGKVDNLFDIYQKLDTITPEQLLSIANEIISLDNLYHLIYK